MSPALTTVRFPLFDMGYLASEMLIKKLLGEAIDEDKIVLKPELVIRQSSKNI
jgi:LacI family transcriptional regulator